MKKWYWVGMHPYICVALEINHGPIEGDIKMNEMDDLETNEVQCNVKDIQDDLLIMSCLCIGK
jgi:hypothetical protein